MLPILSAAAVEIFIISAPAGGAIAELIWRQPFIRIELRSHSNELAPNDLWRRGRADRDWAVAQSAPRVLPLFCSKHLVSGDNESDTH